MAPVHFWKMENIFSLLALGSIQNPYFLFSHVKMRKWDWCHFLNFKSLTLYAIRHVYMTFSDYCTSCSNVYHSKGRLKEHQVRTHSKQNLGRSDSTNWSEWVEIGRRWSKKVLGQCNSGDQYPKGVQLVKITDSVRLNLNTLKRPSAWLTATHS